MTMMLIRLRGYAGWSAPMLFSSTSILPRACQHHGQVTPRISRLRPIVLVPVTAVANIANFLVEGVAPPSSSSFASSQAHNCLVEKISLGKRVCDLFSHLPNNEAIPK